MVVVFQQVMELIISHLICPFHSDETFLFSHGTSGSLLCGIRLIFAQDIEEFADILVQCRVGSLNAYLIQYLLDKERRSQGCDHEKDFSCTFSLQIN